MKYSAASDFRNTFIHFADTSNMKLQHYNMKIVAHKTVKKLVAVVNEKSGLMKTAFLLLYL